MVLPSPSETIGLDKSSAISNKHTSNHTTKMSKRARDANTIFIRNIPPKTTRNALEDFFSEYGPVKKCSLISTQKCNANTTLYGFVKYVHGDDCDDAVTTLKEKGFDEESGLKGIIIEKADSAVTKNSKPTPVVATPTQADTGEANTEEKTPVVVVN